MFFTYTANFGIFSSQKISLTTPACLVSKKKKRSAGKKKSILLFIFCQLFFLFYYNSWNFISSSGSLSSRLWKRHVVLLLNHFNISLAYSDMDSQKWTDLPSDLVYTPLRLDYRSDARTTRNLLLIETAMENNTNGHNKSSLLKECTPCYVVIPEMSSPESPESGEEPTSPNVDSDSMESGK